MRTLVLLNPPDTLKKSVSGLKINIKLVKDRKKDSVENFALLTFSWCFAISPVPLITNSLDNETFLVLI